MTTWRIQCVGRRPRARFARTVVLLSCLTAGVHAASLAAQLPAGTQVPGMPDLSSAPADVQAIWKKLMSGGAPTQAEGKRLSDWMQANKDQIIKATTAKADSMQRAMGGPAIGVRGADQAACPTKTTIPASLALDPTSADATALLDSLRRTYDAKLSPHDAGVVHTAINATSDPAQLNTIGGAFYIEGYPTPAVLAFIAEASKATGLHTQPAWGDLGAGLIGAGDYLHAVRAIRRSLAVGTRTAPYVTNLAVAYADLGDLKTATTLLNEATGQSKSWAPAWDALSRVASCSGDQAMALRAVQNAQESDWSDSRQDQQDQIQQQNSGSQQDPNAQSSSTSDDDAPLPDPPGRSPFPPPPAGHPHTFDAWAPKLGGTWQEQAANEVFDTQMGQAYGQLQTQIYAERDKPWVTSPPGSAGGMGAVFVISNGGVGTHGAQRVDELIGARSAKLTREWGLRDSSILTEGAKRAEPIQAAYTVCMRAANDARCLPTWCRGMTSVVQDEFGERRANTAEYISGLASLSVIATAKMDAWFNWVGDPDSRHAIDRMRRATLASMESIAYIAAAETQAAPPAQCQHLPTQTSKSAKAQADSARDAGECKSRPIHLPKFATMDADCHSMKMSFDYFDEHGTPKLEIQRASSTKNGKFFIGLGTDALGGALSGSIGLQVTWDQGGWVQGAGVAATGEADIGVAHASGDIFVNGRDNGPGVSGSASGSVPAFGFAPSVNFGGK